MGLDLKIKRGFVLVVSAPSGTGKTSLCDRLAEDIPFVVRSISVTTRPQRDGEVKSHDYEFVTAEEFRKKETEGLLLEAAEVFGFWYGTPKAPVEKALSEGKAIVMDIDTVGALRIKGLLGTDAVSVFIIPPSFDELEKRLRNRGKNTPDELNRRLRAAALEIKEAEQYEYIMVNEAFHDAYEQLKSIVFAERARRLRLQLPQIA